MVSTNLVDLVVKIIPITPELGDLFAVQLRNGRTVHLTKMIFNHRLNLMSENGNGWDDAWCYEDFRSALIAMLNWNTDSMSEPEGWKKHPTTGRYRPDSNPDLEYLL